MAKVANPAKNLTFYTNSDATHRAVAVVMQSVWKQLGINLKIKQMEWGQFLEFLGPPPDS